MSCTPPGTDATWSAWRDAVEERCGLCEAHDEVWDCEESHLSRLGSFEDLPTELVKALTPLEMRTLVGAQRDARMEEELASALRVFELPLVEGGAWGGPAPTDVPAWLRDYVVARGGRVFQDRAGLVPCWFFVAQSEDELRAFTRWRYSGRQVAFVQNADRPPGEVSFELTLDFDDGGPPARLEFDYRTNVWEDATALDMLAWVGLVRLEVYSVATGTLEFVFSDGCNFVDARGVLTDPTLRLFPERGSVFDRLATAPADILFMMRNAERVQFELVRRGEKARRDGLRGPSEAYASYLEAVDAAARSQLAGIGPDVAGVDRAKRGVIAALGFVADEVDEIALTALPPGHVFVQLQYVSAWPSSIKASVAVVEGGVLDARAVTIAERDINTSALVPDEEGLAELAALGTSGAVISPAGPLYAQACHEDLLDEGFTQVSYAHRSTVLSSRAPMLATGTGVLLAGYPGDPSSSEFLVSMSREFSVIEDAHSCIAQPWSYGTTLPEVVHLAGHGSAGDDAIDHWLWASDSIGELVTPARVLLEVDASTTSLVFLSACSSGRGEFGVRTVMEAVPLDVAFLERGATCVISASAPVNDVVAAVFAASFHVAWRAGASIWEAYEEARAASSGRGCSQTVADAVGTKWSTWRDDLKRALLGAPEDWLLYRVSGRHW